MTSTDVKYQTGDIKVKATDLISPKKIAELLEVRPKTIKKWEIKYGWNPIWFSHKVKRYSRTEVEESLQISFADVFGE